MSAPSSLVSAFRGPTHSHLLFTASSLLQLRLNAQSSVVSLNAIDVTNKLADGGATFLLADSVIQEEVEEVVVRTPSFLFRSYHIQATSSFSVSKRSADVCDDSILSFPPQAAIASDLAFTNNPYVFVDRDVETVAAGIHSIDLYDSTGFPLYRDSDSGNEGESDREPIFFTLSTSSAQVREQRKESDDDDPRCVFFDEDKERWSDEGVKFVRYGGSGDITSFPSPRCMVSAWFLCGSNSSALFFSLSRSRHCRRSLGLLVCASLWTSTTPHLSSLKNAHATGLFHATSL